MKKISFKLITNGKTIIDENCKAIISDNVLKFIVNKDIFCFDLNNDTLLKRSKDSEIFIEPLKENLMITIIQNNMSFDMPLENIIYEKTATEINLTYTFMSDEKTTNCIIIKEQ